MRSKFYRLLSVLIIFLAIFGSSGGVQAANHDRPALTITPASTLGVQFLQVATAANVFLNGTSIDNPLTNGNPDAILIVTPNWNPSDVGGTYDDHPLGVYYDGSKWRIFNEDLAAMPVGATFNVLIPTAGSGVFTQRTSSADIALIGAMVIDNPLTNGNPNANILITQNIDPGGGANVYNAHSVGVWYYASASKWVAFNQNGSSVPLNAGFNVFILPTNAGVFVQTSTVANMAGDYTRINNSLSTGKPDALVFITPNRSPGGIGGIGYTHNPGVWYTGSEWAIFNEDVASMPANASFNVMIFPPTQAYFFHTAVTGQNISGDATSIDNALTNGHPSAVVFATQDYDPGEIVGTYNNHNVGVRYNLSLNQWTILNEDGVAMPNSASFNVVVPNPDSRVLVHKATAANSAGNATTIDHPLLDSHPNAIVLVTQNFNPSLSGGVGDNHPFGVYYSLGKWLIFNEDLAAMPVNASFNVFIPPAGTYVFVQTATVTNISANFTIIDNPLTNDNPNAILLVTQNWDPGGVGGVYNNHSIGVGYEFGRWVIFNEDTAAMTVNASFNVYVYPNLRNYLPIVIR